MFRRILSIVIPLLVWTAPHPSESPSPPLALEFSNPAMFRYCGFVGARHNDFTTAVSTDGSVWHNTGGSWRVPTDAINAPTCLPWRGGWYIHAAAANNRNYHLRQWYVGRMDAGGKVVTIAVIDWTSQIPDLDTCFSGEWFRDDSSQIHLTIPCTTNSAYTSGWKTYETHPTGPDLSTWSDPVDMHVAGPAMYDSTVIQVAPHKFLMWVTDLSEGSSAQNIQMEQASSFLGPYTKITSGDWANWSATLGPHEGPNVYRVGNRWRLMLEGLRNHEMYYSDCYAADFSRCHWSPLSKWSEDLTYRHGTVISPDSLNGSTI